MKRVFISYSWESEEHKNWVAKLAVDLDQNPDLHVVLDQFDLDSTMDKNKFMEDAVYESEVVIVVATEQYEKKSNERKGGVGIETSLNAQHFWEVSDSNGSSNTLVVLRQTGSTPRYLKHQFYIDFRNDELYESNLSTLREQIRGTSKLARPPKLKKPETRAYELTLVSKLIGLSSKKRQELISARNRTDYSGSNKIKFEAWETSTPAPNLIIALHNNVNISPTLNRAAESLLRMGQSPQYITILRDRPRSKSATYPKTEAWKKLTKRAEIKDFSYTDYTWEFCIDDTFKSEPPLHSLEFYTEQDIESEIGVHHNAVSHLADTLAADSDCAPILVRGGGGIGKTSLCIALVSSLRAKHGSKFICHLIRSEDIRRHLDGNPHPKVESVYDLYLAQANYLQQSNILDRDTFELSILSGNLIIVIDGLDEFPSILKHNFDADALLESISGLQRQLGFGRILITSRPSANGLDEAFGSAGFKILDLLGFDTDSRERYLNKRFKPLPDKDRIIRRINGHIDSSPMSEGDRILPFFIDVLSCVYEEAQSSSASDLSIAFTPTPYPSLNELTDHIVHSIIARESNRHNDIAEEDKLLDFFKEATQAHNGTLTDSELEETVQLIFDKNHKEIVALIKKNPLVICTERGISLKYDFLAPYFSTLFILNGAQQEPNKSFATAFSKASNDSIEFKEIVKYFKKVDFSPFAKKVANFLKMTITSLADDDRRYQAVIASASENLSSLIYSVGGHTKEQFTLSIIDAYCDGDHEKLVGLHLKGDVPPFDFRNRTVVKGRFRSYTRFLESDFNQSRFINCVFEECHNKRIKNSTFLQADIDRASCNLGDLSESTVMLNQSAAKDEELLKREIRKFLSGFLKGATFRELKPDHVNFSIHADGLASTNLAKLCSNMYLYKKASKEIDDFFAISPSFQASVHRFLNDGYKDEQMKAFFNFAKGA